MPDLLTHVRPQDVDTTAVTVFATRALLCRLTSHKAVADAEFTDRMLKWSDRQLFLNPTAHTVDTRGPMYCVQVVSRSVEATAEVLAAMVKAALEPVFTCDAQKFVLASNEFGYDMFIADSKGTATDSLDEAMVFTYGEDNPYIKELTFQKRTGLDSFKARTLP